MTETTTTTIPALLPYILQPVDLPDSGWVPRMWDLAFAATDYEEAGGFLTLKMICASHGYDLSTSRQEIPDELSDEDADDTLSAVPPPATPEGVFLIGRTIGEEGRITNWYARPTAPSPAPAARFATPDNIVAEVWKHLPKTPSMWDVVEPLSAPPLWLYEAMDKALTLLPAAPSAAQADAIPAGTDGDGIGYFSVPMGLHPETAKLVADFAFALASKLHSAERKYGYSNGWRRDDWREELVAKLMEHVHKGDPRDVAAYCAFAWHHQWSIAPDQPAHGGSVSDGSDLPPGLVLVETPYRDAPDKWMLIEMTAPGRAKVVTGGYIETEAEGVAHAHSFAGIALSAARASAPEVAQDRVAELEAEIEAWQMASGLCVPPEDKGGDPGGVKPSHLAAHLNELNARLAGYHDNTATFDGPVYSAALRSAGEDANG